jgi:hypothetical protein
LAYLDRLEDDDNIYYSLEKKISTKPADIFSQLIQDKLKVIFLKPFLKHRFGMNLKAF